MRRMWSGRIIAAAVALAAGCASLPPPGKRLDAQVVALLDQRGLGAEALLVADNLVRNGPPAPRATPPLVLELLARPLDALDAAAIFRRVVPASLAGFTPGCAAIVCGAAEGYAEELARAQQALQEATRRSTRSCCCASSSRGCRRPTACSR
jgi:hypothetical protein